MSRKFLSGNSEINIIPKQPSKIDKLCFEFPCTNKVKSKLLNKAFQDLTCADFSCLDFLFSDLTP